MFRRWGYPIIRCTRCALVVTGACEDVSTSSIYGREYYEGGAKDGHCAYEHYGASEQILKTEFSRILRRLRKQVGAGRLLEIGCAYGFFLQVAARWFEVVGVELSEYAAQEAQARGFNIHVGDVLDARLPSNSFDAVVLFDTIEHVRQPRAVLEEVYRVLSPGGVVLITTGDIGSLHARLLGANWRLMTPPQHLFFFARNTMQRLLSSIGFKGLRFECPWKLVPASLILYQARQWYGMPLALERRLGKLGIPVNLFDTMRVTAVKPHCA